LAPKVRETIDTTFMGMIGGSPSFAPVLNVPLLPAAPTASTKTADVRAAFTVKIDGGATAGLRDAVREGVGLGMSDGTGAMLAALEAQG
jgi:hypothetical protein